MKKAKSRAFANLRSLTRTEQKDRLPDLYCTMTNETHISGVEPLTGTKTELRLCDRNIMKMDPLDMCLLRTLARVKFATLLQLVHWCQAPIRTVLRHLRNLEKADLIEPEMYNRPTIWMMTHRAASLLASSMPSGKRRATWSVMSHACHANETEIFLSLQEDTKGLRFLNRKTLFKSGLNPAFGEHGGVDDAERAYFVLVDDYGLPSERIARSWERTHHPPRKFYDGNRTAAWPKIVNRFIVATTDPLRAELLASWIERHKIPASVIIIKQIWR